MVERERVLAVPRAQVSEVVAQVPLVPPELVLEGVPEPALEAVAQVPLEPV